MEQWIAILLPFALLLARVSGFIAITPIFGSSSIPVFVRAGIAMVVTIFFAVTVPVGIKADATPLILAVILLSRELLYGLAVGLAARLLFTAVQQSGEIVGQLMGLTTAEIINPVSGESGEIFGSFFEICFSLFFLAAGGHLLLLKLMFSSFTLIPVGSVLDTAALAEGVLNAGSAMLLFALKLSAPLLGAFTVISVVLAVVSRVLPEINILLLSLPLRIAMGFVLAGAMLPAFSNFTGDMARWMNAFLAG